MTALSSENTPPDNPAARLDKWLWAVRVFKTRPLATAACRRGDVEINGQTAKPARNVHAGETIVVALESLTRTVRVVRVPRYRIGAKLLAEYLTDLTPAAEYERHRTAVLRILARPKGSGRPTKRERRDLDRLFG